MKKVLLFLSCLFLSLTLASCNESKKHTVTYTNANGQEVEVEILQTEDEEEVKDILGYLSQKNQTANIAAMEADLMAEAHAKGTKETEYLDIKGNLDFKLNQNTGFSAKLIATADYSDGSEKQSLDITANTYLETPNISSLNNYLYLDYSINGNVSSIASSAKYKISLLELLIWIQNNSSSLPTLPMSLATTTPTIPQLDEIIVAFDTYLPNSKYYVSEVTDNDLTLNLDIALKDILAANQITVDTDYIISLVFKFDIASGLCNSFNTEINVLEIIKNLNNTNNVSISSFTEFNILISFNVNYNGNVVIDTLTEAEKANYIEYNPNLEEVPSF